MRVRTVERRSVVAAGLFASMALPPAAWSLPPLPAGSAADRLSRMLQSAVGPVRVKPQTLPRAKLENDFAVLLMRSSYSIADQLDYYPMDKFQQDQFLFRQDEWELYREALPGVQQGLLTEPAYFDFISFVQYATISKTMREPKMLFNELIDANGTSVVVTRPAELADDALLPVRLSERMGEAVLAWIDDRYSKIRPKVPSVLTAAAVREGVQAILNIYEINGYMLLSKLEPTAHGLKTTLVAPATLWSQSMLRNRRDLPNDFEAKTVVAYLKQCGLPATVSTSIAGNSVEHTFEWPATLL